MNHPTNTADDELRQQIYEQLVNFGLPLGFLENPKRWEHFYKSLDGVMKLITAHNIRLLEALVAEKEDHYNGFGDVIPVSAVQQQIDKLKEGLS